MNSIKFKTVDEYLSALAPGARATMKELRGIIKKAAPKAEELISYNMPAFKWNGILVYYAAHKEHIGFYPFTSAIRTFKKELSKYEGSKGTVKFPLNQPIPVSLVSKIVKFRVHENAEKIIVKQKQKNARKKNNAI